MCLRTSVPVVHRLGSALKTTEAALRPHKMSLSTALPLTFWKPFLVMTSKANSVSGCGRGKHEVVGRSPVDGRIGEHGDAVVASSNSELEIADDDRVLDGHVDRRQVLHVDAVGVGNKDRTCGKEVWSQCQIIEPAVRKEQVGATVPVTVMLSVVYGAMPPLLPMKRQYVKLALFTLATTANPRFRSNTASCWSAPGGKRTIQF